MSMFEGGVFRREVKLLPGSKLDFQWTHRLKLGPALKGRAHVFVSGIVQGVFFRAETHDLANRLGLVGWVRNLQDGRVEVLIEGEKEAVEQAVDFCKRGPRRASVQSFDVKWEDWKGEFQDFKIIY
jgi:acylphosphatase